MFLKKTFLALTLLGLFVSTAKAASYQTLILSMSPNALWMFSESSGTTLNDQSGNGQTGTYGNSPTLGVTGLINDSSGKTAATFGGDSNAAYATVTNSSQISPTSFTLVLWLKTQATPASYQQIVDMTGATDGWRLQSNGSSGSEVGIDTPSSSNQHETLATNILDGNTHMIAFGMNGSTFFASIDGGTYGTQTVTGTYSGSGNTANLVVDMNTTPEPYVTVQGMAMFSGQLSQTNVNALYTCGTGGSCGASASGAPNNAVIIGQ